MYHDSFANGGLPNKVELTLPDALRSSRPRIAGAFSAGVSLALLIVAAWQLSGISWGLAAKMIPAVPAFWMLFAAYYLAGPLSEWIIYRKLWNIPVAGMAALLRKLVSNELLLGYLGEAQFYAWARSRTKMTAAPFGTIKDVTILSALTGNLATLGMLFFAWPIASSGATGIHMRSAFLSLGVILVTSMAILLFRRRLFSLPRRDLEFIAVAHTTRILAMLGLSALMWHMILPEVPLGLWLVLATLRMLVSRLPLLPNKDVIFAGLAVYLMGREVAIGSLMTMMAAILLAAHLCVGAIFGLSGIVESRRAVAYEDR